MTTKRTPFIAGNWKMYKTIAEARQLVSEMIPSLQGVSGVEKVLCPPFPDLLAVKAILEGTEIGLGAQNMHWESAGAFTGEVSPVMLAELCQYVILGHSERRAYFGETDETVNRKVKAAIAHGLIPIMCIGETLQENEAGTTQQVLEKQIMGGLVDVTLPEATQPGEVNFIVAYEPVWAIGTGKAATSQGANAVVSDIIRPTLAKIFGSQIAEAVRVLYGGSVKASNASEFFKQSDIDGALVGGASLKVEEFAPIVQAAAG
ncbi:MAG: triose-phosphate isomerase [Anaerolineales bacterium]|nr:triose-phosphate isomerase [Anaerolineales bacterium]